ncbi:glycosyltransferase [Bacillus licheniformis]|nr:glycosyltransferase [Bacillus licheniformis]
MNASNIAAYRELARIIDEHRYSIIHCHTPMGGVLARLAARKQRKRGRK